MIIKLTDTLSKGKEIQIEKYSGEKDVSLYGAFREDEKIKWVVRVPRQFGVSHITMRFHRDGEEKQDFVMLYREDNAYEYTLDMAEFGKGLYFYTFIFHSHPEQFYSDPYDNVHFNLTKTEERYFMLTVYDSDFKTPEWFHGGIMYQIFPDRFCKSGKVTQNREDAVYEADWYAPISQYSEYPGAPLDNNLFYGGDLYGIAEKLDYLKSLGVSVIYLNPIFNAYSNHRYDTGDYTKVDSVLGGNSALDYLISKAGNAGIKIILDGVFNHTGDNSLYFNSHGKYNSVGAYQSVKSPYRDWFTFRENGSYDCWWNIGIMPRLNHYNESCRKYFTGENGILAKYVKRHTGGWRLDVADELSDKFLDELRATVKGVDPDAVIIGEVWENAADKIAYGYRRRYVQGDQLDSVMNYPLKNAIIDFIRTGNSLHLAHVLTWLYASYPKCVSDSLMNILGTHDTMRILTELGDDGYKGLSNKELSVRLMSEENKARAIKLLKLASVIQYTVYGVPSLYYGDEAGVEGYQDPFCRRTYPWGKENEELIAHYKKLGTIRSREKVFASGEFKVLRAGRKFIMYERTSENEKIVVAVNLNKSRVNCGIAGVNLLSNDYFGGVIAPESAIILRPFEEK